MESNNSGDKETKDQEGEGVGEERRTQVSKKAEKKTVRALAILKKDAGIEESQAATRIIFVCNAGLVTGCSSSGIWS